MIRGAKHGGDAERGTLLDMYRNYLRLLARVEIGKRLQRKLDESGLVQETMREAHGNFPNFRGSDEPQFASWLRQILAAKVANLVRHYFGTKRRDVRLERELIDEVDSSAQWLNL